MPRSVSTYSNETRYTKNRSEKTYLSVPKCKPCPERERVLEQDPNYHKVVAHLSSEQVVPPLTNTNSATVTLWFARDFSHVNYALKVAQSAEVTQANLHLASAGINGLAVAVLLTNGPNGTQAGPPASGFDGETCGQIKSADLINGLAGSTIAALYNALLNKQIYASVSTTTFPSGALRGQFFVV